MSDVLYLFPDTNLFIQCRPLAELDWSQWQAFDEVHLIVSLPVQREIDYRKNKGNDRVGGRARTTNSLFRELIRSDEGHKLIRAANPSVKLYIKPEYVHNPALAGRLNYAERDDQLIGTISTFLKQHPGSDARLLTDDGTPMATAKSLGIAAAEIPASWLLPPENTESEKRAGKLEAELSRLKKMEPQFKIRCHDAAGNATEKIEYAREHFIELTETQLAALVKRLTDRFPLETDFGRREPAERQTPLSAIQVLVMREVFIPATDKEIAEYRDEKYPQWLQSCKDILRRHHATLNHLSGRAPFCFIAVNEGTRPGKDTLVTIEAKGNFAIMPPLPKLSDKDEDDDEEVNQQKPLELPRPPLPPRGKWRRQPLSAFGDLESLRAFGSISNGVRIRDFGPLIPKIEPFRRDPNAFYYKPQRPMKPQSTFRLECEQWRHGGDDEPFFGEIHFAENELEVSGLLECQIHAENLSDIEVLHVPVRITIASVSVFERAEMLVASLIDRASA